MEPDKQIAAARRPWRLQCAVALLAWLIAGSAVAQTPITLYRNFVGHLNYATTGGSLRSSANTVNACAVSTSSTAVLSGIPAGASVRAAYLYWAGSGSVPDDTVTLNGSPVVATRTFGDRYSLNGTDYDFFSGFADVTAAIAGNGGLTFSGLAVASGAPYCAVEAVLAGWALVVIYEDAAEDLRAVNVFDGFELFRASALTLTVDRFRIPPTPVNGKVTQITWEGDPQNSAPLGGFSESLRFNGNLLDDGLVPPGSAPTIQQFDGTINTLGVTTSHGVDVDTYDVSAYLTPGDTAASTTLSSGGDLVLLSAEVISFTTEPVVDLEIDKSHGGNFSAGTIERFTLAIGNNGPEREVNAVVVTDSLPAGLSYVGAQGAGWSCTAAGGDVTCTHPGPVDVGAMLPALALDVLVSPTAPALIANTATVSSASVDNDPANDMSTDTVTVLGSAPAGAGTKTLYLYAPGTPDPNGFNEGPTPYLSRTPPSATQSDVDIDRNAPPRTWTLTPALRAPLTIDAGTLPVTLYLAKNGNGGPAVIRTLRVALATTGATSGPLGSPVTLTFAAPSGANPLAVTFNVPLASVTTLPAGTQLALTLTNLTPGGGTQRIRVFPTQGGDFSRIELPALTVINIDSAATFAGAYPAAVAQSSFVPGAAVSLRATVSDPFGRFDIARVEIDLGDPLGNVVAAAAPMTPVAAVSEAAGIYEYLLTLPATAAPGNWDYRLTAIEGSEGLIRHSFSGSFAVGGARLLVTKSAQTVADPINGVTNPKAIPGAVVLYSLSVANNGAIATDADSVVITDALPDNVALYVEAAGGDPVVFLDGSPGSGLSFDYAGDVSYSSAPGGGPPFSHAPAPDASGFDPAITGIRINPSGALGADSGAGAPAFELRYRIRID